MMIERSIVWWSSAHTYKNAITNELFLYTSARGYQLTGDATFLTNAKKAWAWRECIQPPRRA